ncbi:hypothetical protein FRB98_005733 [Tulasnella sp. 332]|nr:hypothetical protein FRB98_005733 [Tulasnella sp. 332]
MGRELYPDSFSEDIELANQANTGMGTESASAEGLHWNCGQLRGVGDREYEERLQHSTPLSEAPSVKPSTVTSVSMASVNDRTSVVEGLSEVDLERWVMIVMGMKSTKVSRAQRTIPRAARCVARFFKIGKEFVCFLSGGAVVTLPTILK